MPQRSDPSSAPADLRDRAAGVLVGLAAGDRNGGPVELALRLAMSLIERRGFDPADVGARYLAWWRAGAFDTGPVFDLVMRKVDRGCDFAEAARLAHEALGGRSAGCNPAHRCAPLAAAGFLPDAALARCAKREAALTHHDPLAGDVAAAVVVLARQLVRGVPLEGALRAAAHGRSPRTRRALAISADMPLRRGGYAPDVLSAAVHFLAAAHDPAEALRESVRFAGPPNYSPVLVGALAGARWGASALPQPHLAHCQVLESVRAAAAGLAATWDASAG